MRSVISFDTLSLIFFSPSLGKIQLIRYSFDQIPTLESWADLLDSLTSNSNPFSSAAIVEWSPSSPSTRPSSTGWDLSRSPWTCTLRIDDAIIRVDPIRLNDNWFLQKCLSGNINLKKLQTHLYLMRMISGYFKSNQVSSDEIMPQRRWVCRWRRVRFRVHSNLDSHMMMEIRWWRPANSGIFLLFPLGTPVATRGLPTPIFRFNWNSSSAS